MLGLLSFNFKIQLILEFEIIVNSVVTFDEIDKRHAMITLLCDIFERMTCNYIIKQDNPSFDSDTYEDIIFQQHKF